MHCGGSEITLLKCARLQMVRTIAVWSAEVIGVVVEADMIEVLEK